jgi:lactate dehydrogenase-like 2-hydroxyacid dehydrogenase
MIRHEVMLMYPLREVAMSALEKDFKVLRYDLASDKISFLREFGSECQAVIINGHTELSRKHIELLPKLKLVSCVSAGFETFDLQAMKEKGIQLTNTSVALLDDVADLATLLILACVRDFVAADSYVRSQSWPKEGMYPLQTSMRNKRIGIAGMGSIGSAIADRVGTMASEIAYHNRTPKTDCSFQYFANLDELAEWSDILIAAMPGGENTKNLISEKVLEAVGPKGVFINISRGSVVDETALFRVLKNGRLGRAGLDVFWNEPNPNIDLVSLPNVTLYPHHASGTVESRDAMALLALNNVRAFFDKRPLITPVFEDVNA